ncbi:hypothetical protein C1646_776489 [Rhizophagus diaphanus]|nr:hypothetical protein C1646_776489 [Rhizophagus diaphanus] [Rhizophagus sp. MUCL 43196]
MQQVLQVQKKEQEEQESQWISNTGKQVLYGSFFRLKQMIIYIAVANWIVTDELSFNTVRGKGFKRMINNINPAFIPPCYVILKWDIGCGYKIATSRTKTRYIEKLKVLELEKKVNVVVTNNGSNIVKAINEWDGMSKVVYLMHILQLCVLKGLKQIKLNLQKYAKLNQFIESPKQTEKLEDAQKEIIKQEERITNETGLLPFVKNNENIDENNQHNKMNY